MKIKKPEDEKYFKDVVLNDILEEISNEHVDAKTSTKSQETRTKKRKSSTKIPFTKLMFYITLIVIFLLFITMLFKLLTDATMTQKPLLTIQKSTTIDNEEWKMAQDRVPSKNTLAPKILKDISLPEEIEYKPMEIKIPHNVPISEKKTERELAKEALKQQMLN